MEFKTQRSCRIIKRKIVIKAWSMTLASPVLRLANLLFQSDDALLALRDLFAEAWQLLGVRKWVPWQLQARPQEQRLLQLLVDLGHCLLLQLAPGP